MGNINRRAALLGAVVSTAALAVPAAASVHREETPHDEVNRLLLELATAMNKIRSGLWFARADYEDEFILINRAPNSDRQGVLVYERQPL